MRALRFRVRTLIAAVGLVAVLIWAAMMGSRSYDYYRRAREYSAQERGWRQSVARGHLPREFCAECAHYFAQLVGKYRRAMWRPWLSIAPDPYAPGVEAYLEQKRREAAKSHAEPQSKLIGHPDSHARISP
ncbi:MAG TPA: hypothetical protein VGZ22_29815 [Isosphaeraceae bacterium]|jgi:hypothetical protein|nr:hypothetical protein [Isosphaeraceae bacterium]